MFKEMRYITKLNFLFFIIAFLLICIVSFELFNQQIDAQFYCGVKDPPVIEETFLEEQNSIPGYEAGGDLFKENCKSCHKIHEESVGPALVGVTERRPKKWLYAFIQNPMRLINKGDTMAVNLYNRYNKNQMMAFPTLSKVEIDTILIYIESGPVPHLMAVPEVRAMP